jgi:hypothetical protein
MSMAWESHGKELYHACLENAEFFKTSSHIRDRRRRGVFVPAVFLEPLKISAASPITRIFPYDGRLDLILMTD